MRLRRTGKQAHPPADHSALIWLALMGHGIGAAAANKDPMRTLLTLLLALLAALHANAQEDIAPAPVVKIINFTADWCPNCAVVDPRIDEALANLNSRDFQLVEVDMTQTKRVPDAVRDAAVREAIQLVDSHQAGYVWDWYGGLTGLSTIIAADNGEPISCIAAMLSVEDIEFRLKEARILTLRAPAGQRKPQGPDCPHPDDL
ncbi:MAG: thioredoxin domain-containing protein [Pseudomonadota bacterium]